VGLLAIGRGAAHRRVQGRENKVTPREGTVLFRKGKGEFDGGIARALGGATDD